jgi:hypothetical protein
MIKIIQKYGNSIIIRFNSQEALIYELNVGDFVDLEISKITKPKIPYSKIAGGKKDGNNKK